MTRGRTTKINLLHDSEINKEQHKTNNPLNKNKRKVTKVNESHEAFVRKVN